MWQRRIPAAYLIIHFYAVNISERNPGIRYITHNGHFAFHVNEAFGRKHVKQQCSCDDFRTFLYRMCCRNRFYVYNPPFSPAITH
ncbi:MAG: hypothetical protein WCF57_02120 [Pyrinomonadaceae bacterium]